MTKIDNKSQPAVRCPLPVLICLASYTTNSRFHLVRDLKTRLHGVLATLWIRRSVFRISLTLYSRVSTGKHKTININIRSASSCLIRIFVHLFQIIIHFFVSISRCWATWIHRNWRIYPWESSVRNAATSLWTKCVNKFPLNGAPFVYNVIMMKNYDKWVSFHLFQILQDKLIKLYLQQS